MDKQQASEVLEDLKKALKCTVFRDENEVMIALDMAIDELNKANSV